LQNVPFSDLKCEILAQCLAVLCTVRQVQKHQHSVLLTESRIIFSNAPFYAQSIRDRFSKFSIAPAARIHFVTFLMRLQPRMDFAPFLLMR
jgi:hypothetical protein